MLSSLRTITSFGLAVVEIFVPIAPVIGLTREFVDTNVGYPLVFDASRSQSELGLVYRPIEQTVTDHFQQMLDDGIVRKRPSVRLP